MTEILAFLSGLAGGAAVAIALTFTVVKEARLTAEMYFKRWLAEREENRRLNQTIEDYYKRDDAELWKDIPSRN